MPTHDTSPARAAAAPQAVTPQPKRAREETFPTTPEEWIRKVRKTGSTELEKERSNAVLSWVTEMLEHVTKYPADKELLREKMKSLAIEHGREEKAQDNMTVLMRATTLRAVPEHIVYEVLGDSCDLTYDDLKLVQEFDPDGPWKLLSHQVGYGLSSPLPKELEAVELFHRWVKLMSSKSGSKIETIKADGRMAANGKINYKDLVLAIQFDGTSHIVKKITHVPTGMDATLPAGNVASIPVGT